MFVWVCFSTLVNLFLYDIDLPRVGKYRCPSRVDFIAQVFPQLEELQATVLREVAAGTCGAINTTAGISTEATTPGDGGNFAAGNSTAADISAAGNSAAAGISAVGISDDAGISAAGISGAAGISAAVVNSGADGGGMEESPMSVDEGGQVAEAESAALIAVDGLKLSESEEQLIGGGSSERDADEHKKSLINLCKTREACSLSLSLSLSVYVYVLFSVCMSVCLSVCLCMCLCRCRCLSVSLSFSLSLSESVSISLTVSLCFY